MRKIILTFISSCFITIVMNATSIKMFDGYYDYAVIINGGGNTYTNYERYWNDCSDFYKLLVNDYGYPKDHIFVIMSDGTSSSNDIALINGGYSTSPLDLDGDGTNDIQYAATKTNISSVFTSLGNQLTSYNKLFVYVTGPGTRTNGTSYVTLWNDVDMSASELNTELNKVTAKAINIILQQDYCGGFVNTILSSNRTITTACSATTQANVLSGNTHNSLSYYWTRSASLTDGDDGDDDGDFDFKAIHEITDEVDNSDGDVGYIGGGSPNLRDNYMASIFINGPSKICSNSVFTTREPTALETIQWTLQNSCLSISNGQGTNSVTLSKNSNGMCYINVTFTIYPSKSITIGRNISVGPPPEDIGSNISIISPTGINGYWSYSEDGNKFSVVGDVNGAITQYGLEYYIYQLDNYFNPSTLVLHGTSYNKTNVCVPSFSAGWYLLKTRGYNECGYSNWLEQEVESIDTSSPNYLLDYSSSSQTLTLILQEPSSGANNKNTTSKTTDNYEIQIWNSSSKVRSYTTNLTEFQMSLSGLPDGIYIIRVIKNDKTYSRKFVKN